MKRQTRSKRKGGRVRVEHSVGDELTPQEEVQEEVMVEEKEETQKVHEQWQMKSG